jgi:L-lactate utilization protein LutB
MLELHNTARRLLDSQTVNLIVGYGEGRDNEPRPVFITTPDKVSQLIFDERCVQNLAVYLLKAEVMACGKIAIVANLPSLRTILQLAAENQIGDGEVVVLTVLTDGKVSELAQFSEMESLLAQNEIKHKPADREKISSLQNQTREERWQFWLNEFSRCLRCYACRAACPLCYCTSCTVDCNQPQWISVQAHTLANLEWHIMRVMHLAGRCIACGACARACPVDIPIHLLTYDLNDKIMDMFNQQAGMKAKPDYVLSTFKTDDKENFIR